MMKLERLGLLPLLSLSLGICVVDLPAAANDRVIEDSKPSANVGSVPATIDTSQKLTPVSPYEQEQPAHQNSMAQVTSVSQLSDVQPTDWAFQALQSLVERYGCIAGYPNGTYRGNRAMTRYEFAAGLNACMDRVSELIESATADLARKEDLEVLRKLQEEFAAELATVRGRVDALEARTSTLEAQQFSTTTKLAGEVVFALAGGSGFGGTSNQGVFQNRVRLGLETSFTGEDSLYTELESGNSPTFDFPANRGAQAGIPTSEGTLSFQGFEGNDIELGTLSYSFPLGKKGKVFAMAVGGTNSDYVPTTGNDPIDDGGDGGSGALSLYGGRNSIYYIGGGSGAAISYEFNELISASVGYLAGGSTDAANPAEGNGLFNGDYAALGQITVTPTKKLTLALTYVNSYHSEGTPIFSYGGDVGVVGSSFANFPGGTEARVVANSGGLQASYRFSPKFVVSAWGGYTNADFRNSDLPNADIWNYALTFAFPDLLKKGSLGGLIVGVQPYLGNVRELGFTDADDKVPLHVEAFYRYALNDFISITPGIVYLHAPDQQDDDKAVVGVLRTTFTF
jgi:Carbohydrate-selective porin, OprB family/S-layer homology domain